MLVAQFVGSAMFFPLLFRGGLRGWRAWLAMMLTAGPMLMLAAWLAQVPISRVLVLWVHVAGWVVMLALWGAVARGGMFTTSKAQGLPSLGFRNVLHALAMLLSAGGLLLWYLQSEFRPASNPLFHHVFPLPALLPHVTDSSLILSPLLSTAALSAAAVVILAVNVSRRRKSAH